MSSDQGEEAGQEKDPEQQRPPPAPAELETPKSQDVAKDNGSKQGVEPRLPLYPPEVEAVLERFPTRRNDVGALWRTRLREDTSPEAVAQLVEYCKLRAGGFGAAPLKSHEAAARVFGEVSM